jgi:aryl-alcohol dehydrogenase-like predicted oxidoreductase
MQYRELGTSGIKVSEISLGCWTLGGISWVDGRPNGWANVDEAEVARAVDLALEKGVNHFDNADVYGNGRAERLLAQVLGERSKNIIIASKIGWYPGTAAHAYEPAHIRHQCEQSLINLKRDVIDLYYFHHGDFGPNDRYLADAVVVMNKLKAEGKIRAIGLSSYSNADFERLVPKIQPQVLQSWANSADIQFIREDSSVQKLLRERKMSFVAFSPLAQGVLLGEYRPGSNVRSQFEPGDQRRESGNFSEEHLAEMAPKMDRLKTKFGDSIEALSRAALQYPLSFPNVACVIPGFRNQNQVRINLAASDNPLTQDEREFITTTFA